MLDSKDSASDVTLGSGTASRAIATHYFHLRVAAEFRAKTSESIAPLAGILRKPAVLCRRAMRLDGRIFAATPREAVTYPANGEMADWVELGSLPI